VLFRSVSIALLLGLLYKKRSSRLVKLLQNQRGMQTPASPLPIARILDLFIINNNDNLYIACLP
jgi:hypothetical protein